MKALITSLAIVVVFASAIRAQESSPTLTASEATAPVAEIQSGYDVCENDPGHGPGGGLEKSEEHKKTISPGGRFAVLCPVRDEKSEHYPPNLLVRLKPYAGLAKLNKD